MSILHTDAVDHILSSTVPNDDTILAEMEERADRDGFPTIGHEVGSFLRLCARLTGARSVFEFGSGYGYSAYWVAPALGDDGQIVLTEVDREELELAREYFERGGYADRAVFEAGDALDVIDRYDGPFDLVLVDHENHRYVDGFEAVREKIAPGGVVVADNVLNSGTEMTPRDLDAYLTGDASADAGSTLEGVTEYYERVRDDPEFETTVVPVGEGLFASVRTS
ncbi:class I SAM-dependent methyltransferase [Halomontanus rarus]|uniref:class I SAM-dependent methyltransferase n=1 Tax=Halomontanus rarus TaxID=3034020 RepID=UPI001A99E9D0